MRGIKNSSICSQASTLVPKTETTLVNFTSVDVHVWGQVEVLLYPFDLISPGTSFNRQEHNITIFAANHGIPYTTRQLHPPLGLPDSGLTYGTVPLLSNIVQAQANYEQ